MAKDQDARAGTRPQCKKEWLIVQNCNMMTHWCSDGLCPELGLMMLTRTEVLAGVRQWEPEPDAGILMAGVSQLEHGFGDYGGGL